MEAFLNWVKDNTLYCAIAAAALIILLIIVIALIVKKAKKKKKKNAQNILKTEDLPTTPVEDEPEEQPEEKPDPEKAEMNWLKGEEQEKKPEAVEEKKEEPTEEKVEEPVAEPEESTEVKEEAEEKTEEPEVKEEPVEEKATKETAEEKKEESVTVEEKKEETEKPTAKKSAPKAKTVKKEPAKEEPVKEEKKAVAKIKVDNGEEKKGLGKWVVKEKGEDEFNSYLLANNGQILLSSEIYSTAEGAVKGIQTIKKNIEVGTFQIYCDKNRNYYFKLKTAQNKFLCAGETYKTKTACQSAIESVKKFAESPISETVEQELTVIKYTVPADDADVVVKDAYAGKWKIVEVDGMYMAQLFASNGELLLSSEAYSQTASAKSAINTIKTNGISGNFVIDSDKKGRYYFKLRNAQKSTLCVGETYSQVSSCQSAIESVRRFLKTAKLVEPAPEKEVAATEDK